MKRLLVLFFILFRSCSPAFSQAMIGYNMSEVKGNYPNEKWEFGFWDKEERLQTMSFEDENVIVIYYFNKSFVCFTTTIVPKTQGILQGWIENYNKKYVIVNDTNWKFYTPSGILNCSLDKTENGLYYFRWYK